MKRKTTTQTAERRKVLGNIGWLFFDRAVRMLVGLVVGAWIARYLGPAKFGTLNFAIALATVFTAIAALGLDGLLVREIVWHPTAKEEILGTSLVMRLGAGAVAIGVIQVFAWIVRPEEPVTRLVVALVSLATVGRAINVLKPWFESQVQSKFWVIAENIALVILTLVRAIFILTGASLTLFAVAMVGETIVASVVQWFFYVRSGGSISRLSVAIKRVKALVSEGWPLILSGVAVNIYMRIDQIMLGSLADDQSVGIYSAAVRISEIWYVLPMTIVASVGPKLLEYQRRNLRSYYIAIQRVMSSLVALTYIAVVAVILLGPHLIQLLFGETYAGAAPILAVHFCGGLFVVLGVVSGRWLLNEGLTRVTMARTILGALSNVVANLLLIPTFGALGAAIATVLSYALWAYLFHVLTPRTMRMFIMQSKSFLLLGLVHGDTK